MDRIAVVTINRPEVRNALNSPTWSELAQVISIVASSEDVKALIITGAGDKAFVAGADIKALKEKSMVETLSGSGQQVLNSLENLHKPVIAAINGYALGGGCELAMACDLRIASERASMGLPETRLGIVPGAGGTQRLLRLVGLGKAKELIMTGRIVNAEEAMRIGLVNRVVPHDNLMKVAEDTAAEILRGGPLALRLAKAVLNVGATTDIRTGLTLELLAQTILFGSEDRVEGLSAFLEKRDPVYKGR